MEFDQRSRPVQPLRLLILGQLVQVQCCDAELRRGLIANFGAMAAEDSHSAPDLDYRIDRGTLPETFSLTREGQTTYQVADRSDLLFMLEKDVTVELQKRRSDLFFLHAAAIDWRGSACLLAAESGNGKSTTTWGLLHHGFDYLSDELSPIDLDSMRVFPYPHALCLKQIPAAVYPVPGDALDLGRTINIPTRSLPSATVSGPRALGAVFLVTHRPELSGPNLRVVGPAEAAARLYVTALNALAHPNRGLDGVIRISEAVPCFALSSAELSATCALICSTLERAISRVI